MRQPIVCLAHMTLVALLVSGCSIAMALHGNPEPNFDAFRIGSTREQVENQLGQPVSSEVLEEGKKRDTYEFEMGNSPNGHRALMNLYIDLATLFIWELPGTITEAQMGEDQKTQITYSADNRVVAIEGYTPPPPSETHQKAMEAQKQFERPRGD